MFALIGRDVRRSVALATASAAAAWAVAGPPPGWADWWLAPLVLAAALASWLASLDGSRVATWCPGCGIVAVHASHADSRRSGWGHVLAPAEEADRMREARARGVDTELLRHADALALCPRCEEARRRRFWARNAPSVEADPDAR